MTGPMDVQNAAGEVDSPCAGSRMRRSPASSESFNQLIAGFERFKGLHRGFEEDPAQHENDEGQAYLPCDGGLRTPPDQRKCKWTHTADRKDDEGGPEIPKRGPSLQRGCGAIPAIQEFMAVLALDRFILNFFNTEWTRLHGLHFLVALWRVSVTLRCCVIRSKPLFGTAGDRLMYPGPTRQKKGKKKFSQSDKEHTIVRRRSKMRPAPNRCMVCHDAGLGY